MTLTCAPYTAALSSAAPSSSVDVVWITPMNQVIIGTGSKDIGGLNQTLLTGSSRDDLSLSPCVSETAVLVITADDHVGLASDNSSSSFSSSLVVREMGWGDRGRYECTVFVDGVRLEGEAGVAAYEVDVDPTFRWHIYYFSLVYGVATAAGFLLITLLYKLVSYLLET